MLKLEMSDVMATLGTLVPYLIAIAVVLVLAVIVVALTTRKRVANVAVRKMIHAQTWVVAAIAAMVSVVMMLYGPLSTVLTNASEAKYTLSEGTQDAAKALATDIEREGIVLLENEHDTLPLRDKKVNVFGWASTNPVYGGTGSGSLNDQYPTTSLLEGMKQAGFTTNADLSEMYVKYRADRPLVGLGADINDWTLPEVPVKEYGDQLDKAKEFSQTAVVVISRIGGEGADIPTDMSQAGDDFLYQDNGDYADFDKGQSYLELTRTEKDLLAMVTSNFQNVTLVYNGANTLQFDFLDDYPQISSVVWCPPAGQTGFTALGDVLAGTVNPSGRTPDTFVKDFDFSPSTRNYGDFQYTNADELAVHYNDHTTGDPETLIPTFVNYVEGIYVGYKFYETADDEGLINYDATVQYPFGHGLSYTTFEQKMGDVTYADGKVGFDVTVTNTGDAAGKDVVEVYYNPPYTDGGIEKASVNLVAYEKTKTLEPGASETVRIEFDDDAMASFDNKNAKAYVLERGDYDISIQSDSHTVIDSATISVNETVTYDGDNTHDGDAVAATNLFDDAAGDVEYLSRANGFANYDKATAAPRDFTMSDDVKKQFAEYTNYDPSAHNDDADTMPTTGAKNGVRLAELTGKEYDDPQWDLLLDQLDFGDMDALVSSAAYGTAAIDSIGKVKLTDNDGPAALTNNYTGAGSIGFPAATALAATWNDDLARQYGESMGDMARELNVSGWYAPGMNIHRTPFGGRNFEYYSEDAVLSGHFGAQAVAGAQSKGVYAFMKHFALNEQGLNQSNMLCTWVNEQALREIYLKPFEMSVKQGGATAAMSAFNYIGAKWAGAESNLMQRVLRDEWGFRGFVVTDMFSAHTGAYMGGDKAIRNGNDAMLAPYDSSNHISDKSATSMQALRTATHNILYTTANSWRYQNGDPGKEIPMWKTVTWSVVGVLAVILLGCEALAIRRFMRRRKEAKVTIEA